MPELTSEVLEHPATSHRIFIGDSIGCLRVTQAPSLSLPEKYAGPSVQTVILPGFKSHSDHAVQRMAQGTLGQDTWVIAIARKNATIDVVQVAESSQSSSSSSVPRVQGNILLTITENRMRAGIERWVGLAVGSNGIYSCSSSGAFRFTPIDLNSSQSVLDAKTIDLPSPLQHLCFYPPSNPTHFAYGGEEIPVSLWDISIALSEQPQNMAGDDSIESINIDSNTSAATMNSKMKKRKRQAEARAKAKEYMWGEIWRAKNLPNNYLSLPQRANITQISILGMLNDAVAPSESSESSTSQVFPNATIAIGTKDGLLRVYELASGSRKHSREHRIVPADQGAIKTMVVGHIPGQLFIGDSNGKLYGIDFKTGQVQYSFKDITGSITSLCPVAAPDHCGRRKFRNLPPLLVSASQDKLLRLHATALPQSSLSGSEKNGSNPASARGSTLWTSFMGNSSVNVSSNSSAVPTALVWDGKVPGSRITVSKDDSDVDDDDEEDQDDEEVWNKMAEVGSHSVNNGKNATKLSSSSSSASSDSSNLSPKTNKSRTAENGAGHDSDEDDDVEPAKERPKRSKKN